MKELGDMQVFYAFSGDCCPALVVDSGETVRLCTRDFFGNQIRGSDDGLQTIEWDATNPVTGPVYVREAHPGDVLEVLIRDIEIGDTVTSCTGRDESVCADLFARWTTRRCSVENGEVVWNDRLRIPVRPTIGVLGVAPAHGSVSGASAGSHGGNMENGLAGVGTSVFLPVAVEGALFGCGDLHAVAGGGEVGVAGAEVAGRVTATFTVRRDLHLTNPLFKTATSIGSLASAPTLDEAASRAVHDMVALVRDATGADADELAMLFSLVGAVEVCQMVDPQKTVRFVVPRYVLESYGFAL